MEYRHLGRTGLQVRPLCLGTMNFGPETSESDSHASVNAALERGVNFFGTANVYGRQPGEGVTVPIIGPHTAQQLDGALKALNTELSGETLKKLDDIWPGPGGQAPEAYAW